MTTYQSFALSSIATDNATTSSSPHSYWEPKFPFDLVVSYEDTTTRNHALQLYDHLAQKLLDDYDFQCTWWKFEHLLDPALMEQAADAVVEANMVIIAVRAGKELPLTARNWIEQWVARKDSRKSALVAVIVGVDAHRRETCPAQLYLQKAARRAKMDFFSHTVDLPKESPSYSLGYVSERTGKVFPLLQGILNGNVTPLRWGNE